MVHVAGISTPILNLAKSVASRTRPVLPEARPVPAVEDWVLDQSGTAGMPIYPFTAGAHWLMQGPMAV